MKWAERKKIDRSINCKRLNRFFILSPLPIILLKVFLVMWAAVSSSSTEKNKKKLSITNWVTNKLFGQLLSHHLDTDPLHRIKLINFPPSLSGKWKIEYEVARKLFLFSDESNEKSKTCNRIPNKHRKFFEIVLTAVDFGRTQNTQMGHGVWTYLFW